jgi:NAD(P)-dependent dehydrogenase (short-subunit alcohol dehydrogenase family)
VVLAPVALVHVVLAKWGRLDLRVDNAGVFGPVRDVAEIAVEDWPATVDTNLTGSFLWAWGKSGGVPRHRL